MMRPCKQKPSLFPVRTPFIARIIEEGRKPENRWPNMAFRYQRLFWDTGKEIYIQRMRELQQRIDTPK